MDGLADDRVWGILEDSRGHLHFATGAGTIEYDGSEFLCSSAEHRLTRPGISSPANAVMEDGRGHLWAGTSTAGIVHYDSLVWQNITREDGLVNNTVWNMLADECGDLWLGTGSGVVRYRPNTVPPLIRLLDVAADRQYGPAASIRIRYEYREQLVRLGVLPWPWAPDPLTRRDRANGFAPDPYGSGR